MKNTGKKRGLALLLCAAVLAAALPTAAEAAGEPPQADFGDLAITGGAAPQRDDRQIYLGDGTYTVSGVWSGRLDSFGFPKAVITVPSGVTANIILDQVTIDVSGESGACALAVEAGGRANVTLSGANTLKSGNGRAGLEVPEGAVLNLGGGQADSLDAAGGNRGAGIGGGGSDGTRCGDGGTIMITGGTVNATGNYGAGIGGGGCNGWGTNGGNGGSITIGGDARVTATGDTGAGIGGGWDTIGGDGGTITIEGAAWVEATGGDGAGIGGGSHGDGGEVIIRGGTVIAAGDTGAGIGGGAGRRGGSVRISGQGTSVTAQSGSGCDVGRGAQTGNRPPDGGSLSVTGGATLELKANGTNAANPEYKNCTIIDAMGRPTVYGDSGLPEVDIVLDAVNADDPCYTWDGTAGVLTITADGNYTITRADKTASVQRQVVVKSGVTANIILDNLDVDVSGTYSACALAVEAGGTANVTLSGANTLKSGRERAGLEVPEGAVLTLGGGEDDSLDAAGGPSGSSSGEYYSRYSGGGAGIGGGGSFACISLGIITDYRDASGGGKIIINGGKVTATGGGGGAGIGGGGGNNGGDSVRSGDGGTIMITGGTVTANGSAGGAGIGGGGGSSYGAGGGGAITITGGKVTANGGGYGAGIGGGYCVDGNSTPHGGDGGTITIGGDAHVEAASVGAGISGGWDISGGSGGNITIEGAAWVEATGGHGAGIGGAVIIRGGTVIATGDRGAGIGGGWGGMGGSVRISGQGTSVTAQSGSGCDVGRGEQVGSSPLDGGSLSVTGGATLELKHNGTNAAAPVYKNCTIIDAMGRRTVYGDSGLPMASPALSLAADPADGLDLPGAVTLTAVLTGAVPGNGGKNIVFTVNGTEEAVAGTDASGRAVHTVTNLAPGMYTFSASFAGDGDNYAAAADVTGYPARRITAAPAALDFGSGRAGAAVPSERTVTVVNEGGQTVTLTPPAAADYAVGPLSRTDLAPGETAAFTVQPKPGLAPGQHDETLTIQTTTGPSAAVELNWTVTPAGGGGGGSSTTTATVKNPDGSSTTTEKRADGTVVETTQWPDGSSREVTTSKQKQADGSTLKVETVVNKNKDGDTAASAAVTTDSGTGTVTLPAGVLDKVADVPGAELTVRLPGAELVFDHAAITAILAAGGKTPELVIAPVAFKDLPQKVRERLNEAMTYGFTVNGGGVDFGAGRVAVALDYTRRHEDTAIAVYYIDDAGDLTRIPGARLEDGKVRFETSHWSVYAVVEEPFPFTDVSAEDWCYDAVAYVSGRGLMTGTGGSSFSPEITVTRAQLAAILWRMEHTPEAGKGAPFTDVAPGAWYAGAAAWCAEQRLMDGYGDGRFGPEDPVTREQLVTVLYRYALSKVWDVSAGEDTNILSYTDAFDAAEWAVPALQWACGAGIVTGTGDGRLNPQGTAVRAELAVMLLRLSA